MFDNHIREGSIRMGTRGDIRDFLINHKESLLRDLQEMTKDFPFKPLGNPPEGPRGLRLEELFKYVRCTAIKAFRRMPLAVRRAEDQNDWIQEAFEILCKETSKFKPAEPHSGKIYYYDVYIKVIVFLRLIDKLRASYRTNPAVEDKQSGSSCESIRKLKPKILAKEVAGSLRISPEEAEAVIRRDAPRVFEQCDRERLENFTGKPIAEPSPEKICLQKELMGIILKCLEKLKPKQREIVLKRYFYGETYKEIADRLVPKTTLEAIRSQARRGLRILKNCVFDQPGVGVPA